MTPTQPLDYVENYDQLEELKAMDSLEFLKSPFEDNIKFTEIDELDDVWPIAS